MHDVNWVLILNRNLSLNSASTMSLFDNVFCWAEHPDKRGSDSFYAEIEGLKPRPKTTSGARSPDAALTSVSKRYSSEQPNRHSAWTPEKPSDHSGRAALSLGGAFSGRSDRTVRYQSVYIYALYFMPYAWDASSIYFVYFARKYFCNRLRCTGARLEPFPVHAMTPNII